MIHSRGRAMDAFYLPTQLWSMCAIGKSFGVRVIVFVPKPTGRGFNRTKN